MLVWLWGWVPSPYPQPHKTFGYVRKKRSIISLEMVKRPCQQKRINKNVVFDYGAHAWHQKQSF